MKVVIQRVKAARVTIEGRLTGAISRGLLLFVGFCRGDTEENMAYLANKIVHIRIFEDDQGKMNHSILDVKSSILSVSQFTLYADCNKGRRPHFLAAADPTEARQLYTQFNDMLRCRGVQVETGQFGANMEVSLINDGPATFILEA